MTHVLDKPAWSALTSRHADLAEGGSLARRYQPSIVPFAAMLDNAPQSLQALAALVSAGDSIVMLQADEIALPVGFTVLSSAAGVQMVADGPHQRVCDERVQPLTASDAAAMLALATLTKPGPFSLRARELGDFWGVKVEGRLVAMAGERMKLPGYTELSGVCTHPDARGRGFGRLLSQVVAGQITARGQVPFLHAYAANAAAIALYESIGFRVRIGMNVAFARHGA